MMNVQVLQKTIVTMTVCVPTLKDRTFVAVKEDILGMVKTAQVNTSVRSSSLRFLATIF